MPVPDTIIETARKDRELSGTISVSAGTMSIANNGILSVV